MQPYAAGHADKENRHLSERPAANNYYHQEKNRNRRKTESITFRLDSAIVSKLRQEAERKDISLNTLISQIAKQHTSWHSNAAKAGFISVRKSLVMRLLNDKGEEEIKSIAKFIAHGTNKDFLLFLRNRYNIYAALEVIENWIRISNYPYTHDITDEPGSRILHTFVVQHDMGFKWSLYLAELYRNLFEELGRKDSRFEMTDNTLAFELSLEKDSEYERYSDTQPSRRKGRYNIERDKNHANNFYSTLA